MTLDQLEDWMSSAELTLRLGLNDIRKFEHDQAKRQADKGMKPRGRKPRARKR